MRSYAAYNLDICITPLPLGNTKSAAALGGFFVSWRKRAGRLRALRVRFEGRAPAGASRPKSSTAAARRRRAFVVLKSGSGPSFVHDLSLGHPQGRYQIRHLHVISAFSGLYAAELCRNAGPAPRFAAAVRQHNAPQARVRVTNQVFD